MSKQYSGNCHDHRRDHPYYEIPAIEKVQQLSQIMRRLPDGSKGRYERCAGASQECAQEGEPSEGFTQ
jgi:hypothetical protein